MYDRPAHSDEVVSKGIEITPELIEAGAEIILEYMFRYMSFAMDEPNAYSISEKVCEAISTRAGN